MPTVGEQILELMGGESNIKSITYCATRLRPTFYDKDKVEVEKIRKLNSVVGIVDEKGRFQIIIGTNVGDVYQEIMAVSDLNSEKQLDIKNDNDIKNEDNSNGGSKFDKFLSFVVSIFNPLLPILAGSGLIRGLTILAVQLGFLAEDSTTNAILTIGGTAVFHFLPILVAITVALRLKASPYIAAIIIGTLIIPDFLALAGNDLGSTVSFFGLQIPIFDYTGQIIAPIIVVWGQSKIEHFLKDKLPSSLHLVLIPTLLISIMIPIAIIIVGPFGNFVSIGLANVVNYITNWNSIITGAIIGGIWNPLIMLGVHWAPNTMIVIPEIAQTGESALIAYEANSNFGMAGAVFAMYLRSRNSQLRVFSLNSITSVFLSGIVEPAIYGLGVPFKTPLIAGSLGGAMGGAFMGAFGVVGYSFVFGGLTTIPAFAGPTLIYYVLGLTISFLGGMILTFLVGWDTSRESELFPA
ncbi:PTS transporter subunit EIIC [Amphibacillus sp. Q70]|uniref:PTS transporter subunit EIIC n=1 Tax=Amphibacillus sp. Q70 TaxID=3453416 RepID=UPI003F857A0C